MAMFPLGSVLFPYMPIALRVFEERYLAMLSAVLQDEPGEFGVVLIERGSEVGGGDRRFDIGTVARIEELGTTDGAVAVIGSGTTRIAVDRWVDDGPFPQAEVTELADLEWKDEYLPLLTQAESIVRRTIARAAEFVEHRWSPDVAVDDDPAVASWQLAGIAPLGDMDQLELLRSTSLPQLLTRLIDLTVEAGETLTATWGDEKPGDSGWGTGA
ncbi:LON peptidase substrate-binding domain-containing protein [Micromonospora sp. DT81.3]|uniref:LON peptidase substrate-binding domain-containing protein n=1 Tax=Micromonospora sp. DT81.3 TaxID=3416523 RepID=UPI003CE7F806